jgi:transketolase
MLEITSSLIRQWSRLGPRGVYGQSILALAEDRDDLVVLSADLGNSSGLDRFKKAYPEKFINVGIAEQNLIGVSAGIAKEGFTVFASSFAPFISLRAGEQIRMNLGYMGLNVKAVAIGSGIAMGFLGNSHYGLEDIAVIRAISNIMVVSPADCLEVYKVVKAAAEYKGPVYIRLTGVANNPIVYSEDYDFELGKSIILREGEDVSIIATGSMVYESLEAAKILSELGISAGVINMHTIHPLDAEAIEKVMFNTKLLVTVEEHSVVGGLGSAVAEFKADIAKAPPLIIMGLPNTFGKTGEYRYLLDKYELTSLGIANKVVRRLKNMNFA